MLNQIVANAPQFLLIAVRCFALIQTTPLLSSRGIPRAAKIALAGCVAYLMFPYSYSEGWKVESYSLNYVFVLIGEGMLGVITGFYINMIFAAFSSAGQFFSLQMGFSAAEAYDSLSQVENPIMGQYLNLAAMIIFLQVKGFQRIFMQGIMNSFQAINAFTLLSAKDNFMKFMLSGLTELFFDAMLISLPMIAALFLVHVSMGILSKAAPQMNLLSEGLPITILISFFLLTSLMPVMADYFTRVFGTAFFKLDSLLSKISAVRL